MILFVAPAQRRLAFVVEDAATLGPEARSAGIGEQVCRLRLLEQEALGLQLRFRRRIHASQWEILAFQVARKAGKRLLQHLFHARRALTR